MGNITEYKNILIKLKYWMVVGKSFVKTVFLFKEMMSLLESWWDTFGKWKEELAECKSALSVWQRVLDGSVDNCNCKSFSRGGGNSLFTPQITTNTNTLMMQAYPATFQTALRM